MKELLERMTHRELMEWEILERIKPFDAERMEWYFARQSLDFYSVHLAEKSPEKTMADLAEFLLFEEVEEKETGQTPEDQVATGKALAATGLVKKE